MAETLARAVAMLLLGACACGIHGSAPAEVVRVTREGRVTVGGNVVSIAALELRPATPIVLRADRGALWMHVQWALAALGSAGHSVVRCTWDEGGAWVDLPVFDGLWSGKLWNPDWEWDERTWGVSWRIAVIEVIPGPPARYKLITAWGDEPSIASCACDIGPWARAVLQRLNAVERERTSFSVEASGEVLSADVLAALVALRDAGIVAVDVGLEAIHPWDAGARVLPKPPHAEPIRRWIDDVSVCQSYPVNLPVASTGFPDKDDDPEARLIVSLTADGRLYLGAQQMTLREFGERLVQYVHWPQKWNGYGEFDEVGPGGQRWSRLFLLLRADRDAPCEVLAWVLAEIRAARIYKLQLGVCREPTAALTAGEAERLWAGRAITPMRGLDAKTLCFLRTGCESPDTAVFDLRSTYGGEGSVGALVRCLDEFWCAGIERVELLGIERAPEARRSQPLSCR